jgi:tetratricopeptide (TPR) repeat protein
MDILPGEKYPDSIDYYQRLVDEYPGSSQALTAFYNLGYLYSEEQMLVPSARAYGEVLKRDPDNPYTIEIHMRLAEAAFTVGFYPEAVKHYRAVLKSGRDEYLEKALYKLGWCFYKLDKYPTAIEIFSRIVDNQDSSTESLLNETIEIMGKTFIEWKGVQSVAAYLKGREAGKSYGDAIYAELGNLYVQSSRFAEAVEAYSVGIDAYPLSSKALVMEKGIIFSFVTLRDAESSNKRRHSWAERYAPGTPWDEANAARLGEKRDAQLEEGLRLAALYRHSRAQRGEGGLEIALEIYRRYDELFGTETEDGYEMGYSYAQALKESGRNSDSAHRYQLIAEHEGLFSHREDASYRRIEVLDLVRRKDPARFDEYVAAHERYVELNPDAAQVPEMLFAVGELSFEVDDFVKARDAFERVATQFTAHNLAGESVERRARCYFREENFPEAERAAREALGFEIEDETRERALKLISFGIFKQAELAQDAGELAQSVTHFFRLAEEFPEGEAAQVSLYRAAENLRTLGREEDSAAVYKRLADTYKDSRYTTSALTLSSEILSSLGDWHGVAQNYEDLYRLKPDEPQAADNLFRAALAREKAKDWLKARELLIEFSETFATDARLAQTHYKLAKVALEFDDEEGALARYRATWDTPAEGDEGVYRARAALAMGERDLALFRAIELKGDLGAALTQKETHLEAAMGRLVDVVGLSFAEPLTAAMYYAGEAFEQFKVAILESERPAGMTEEELEEYQFLLEEKAFPLEDSALEYYRRGVKAARKAKVYNEWVDRMYSRLEELVPWAYQRSEQTSAAWVPPPYPGQTWEVVQ